MKTAFIAALALVLLVASYAESATSACKSGSAKAFVAIQPDPAYLVGTIPSGFNSNPAYFVRRYNCEGRSASVRRVDLGIYDVRFPGLNPRAVVATAISDEAVSVAALPLADGIVRISLRGPIVGNDVMARRDVPFTVVVY